MAEEQLLRPTERCVLRLAAAGVSEDEIARRFRRSPLWVASVIALAGVPRRPGAPPRAEGLRPLERCVLRWRGAGAQPSEIGLRFHRGARFIEQVEELARYKLRLP